MAACKSFAPKGGDAETAADDQILRQNLAKIRNKVMVMSGKGGVGKSTVAVNLAVSLTLVGKRVGLLDVDIHGPSVPGMLGLDEAPMRGDGGRLIPIEIGDLKVMSIGLLLRQRDDAVIWRGPMKMGVIKQFLQDVEWGDLDYLVIDAPPGTGDEPLSICQLIPDADGAVVVTTPQKVAVDAVRKSISFCNQLKLPVIGVVENMSGFVCPKCGESTEIFNAGGGEAMATDLEVPFLGRVPIDPAVGVSGDDGRAYIAKHPTSETAKAFNRVAAAVLKIDAGKRVFSEDSEDVKNNKQEGKMKIAIPIAAGKLAMHFGHCESFAMVEVDAEKKTVLGVETIAAPEHQPGLLPKWLGERGANVIIAGGMGSRAQELFAGQGIKVMVGAPAETPEKLAAAYLDGSLQTGGNTCDH